MKPTGSAIIVASALALSAPAFGQAATPDYIGFSERIEPASDFLYMSELCEIIGYQVDDKAFDKTIRPMVVAEIKGGMSVAMASNIVSAAAKRREEDEGFLAKDFGSRLAAAFNKQNMDEATTVTLEYYDYIDGKCRGFAESTEFAELITTPTPEQADAGFKNFMSWLEAGTTGKKK